MTSYTYHFLALVVIGLLVRLPQSVRPSDLEDGAVAWRGAAPERAPRSGADSGSALAALAGAGHGEESAFAHDSSGREQMVGAVQKIRRGVGIKIPDEWMNFLFDLIDGDGNGQITEAEWMQKVKGPGAKTMWPKLNKDGDADISHKEFRDWDDAVTEAFEKMGAITKPEIDRDDGAFKDTTQQEKEFAKSEALLGADQKMDRSEFERFLFTVLAFRAMKPNGEDSTKEEVDAVLRKLETHPTLETFVKSFFEAHLQVEGLYKYFAKNGVFADDAL